MPYGGLNSYLGDRLPRRNPVGGGPAAAARGRFAGLHEQAGFAQLFIQQPQTLLQRLAFGLEAGAHIGAHHAGPHHFQCDFTVHRCVLFG